MLLRLQKESLFTCYKDNILTLVNTTKRVFFDPKKECLPLKCMK